MLSGFFDIVDLDEGTCGRRLAVSGVIEASVDRLKLSRSHMSFTYSICNGRSVWLWSDRVSERYCAERLLEMSWLIVEFHCDWLVT